MRIHLQTGEEARAVRMEGQMLVLVSPRAFAPGAPISFSLDGSGLGHVFEGRTIGSRRLDEGGFEVRMRFVNLRRADRDRLLQALG